MVGSAPASASAKQARLASIASRRGLVASPAPALTAIALDDPIRTVSATSPATPDESGLGSARVRGAKDGREVVKHAVQRDARHTVPAIPAPAARVQLAGGAIAVPAKLVPAFGPSPAPTPAMDRLVAGIQGRAHAPAVALYVSG